MWLEKLYQKLYSKIGGRPWTEIIRDDQKAHPLVYLLIFALLGLLVAKFCKQYWWQILLGFAFGILCGHFWW